jgi:hypothetical protein
MNTFVGAEDEMVVDARDLTEAFDASLGHEEEKAETDLDE